MAGEADFLARRRYRAVSWLALAGAALTAAQAGATLVRGEPVCLNEGCRVVEALTRVPPLAMSLAGLAWFLLVAAFMRSAARRAPWGINWGMLLLLAGMAAEGVLFGFQLYVAKGFCAYCLAVFALVLGMNLAAGWAHGLAAGGVLAAVLLAFAALRFAPSPAGAPGARGLDAGTFAVRRCSAPAKQLYLVFSSSCPHCAEVLRALETCTSCNFHFNPIDRIDELDLAGIEPSAGYDPAVNRALLGMLGVDQVPVLVAVGPEGFSVIRGEQRILAYVRAECFREAPVLNVDPSRPLGSGSVPLFRTGDEEGCNVAVECPDDGGGAGAAPPADPFTVLPKP